MKKNIAVPLISLIICLFIAGYCDSELLTYVSIGIFCVIIINELMYRKPKPGAGQFNFFINQIHIKSKNMKIQKSQFPVKGHIEPSTDAGLTEPVETVAYSSDNEGSVKVVPDADDPENPNKFQLEYGGELGNANINATADGRIGEGVKTLTDNLFIEVIEDEASRLNMKLDLPE